MYWRDFSNPPSWNSPRGPDLSYQIAPRTCFELQGVLVIPDGVTSVRGGFCAANLTVLPKGPHTTQLEQLKPLRTLYASGLLAEYRVFFEQEHLSYDYARDADSQKRNLLRQPFQTTRKNA